MVIELREQDRGQQAGFRHAARDRPAGSGLLDHALAAAAGFLHSGDLDHLDLRCDHVEQFADILPDHTQIAAAVGAIVTGIKFAAFAWRIPGHPWATPRFLLRWGFTLFGWRVLLQGLVILRRRVVGLRRGDHQVFERQFDLCDLALDLFGAGTKLLILELGDPDPQGLHEQIMGAQARRDFRVFSLQGSDQLLQSGRIIGHECAAGQHRCAAPLA